MRINISCLMLLAIVAVGVRAADDRKKEEDFVCKFLRLDEQNDYPGQDNYLSLSEHELKAMQEETKVQASRMQKHAYAYFNTIQGSAIADKEVRSQAHAIRMCLTTFQLLESSELSYQPKERKKATLKNAKQSLGKEFVLKALLLNETIRKYQEDNNVPIISQEFFNKCFEENIQRALQRQQANWRKHHDSRLGLRHARALTYLNVPQEFFVVSNAVPNFPGEFDIELLHQSEVTSDMHEAYLKAYDEKVKELYR